MLAEHLHHYSAILLGVVDGDTIDVDVDLGFNVRMEMRLRLAGIDAPEIRSSGGEAAAKYLLDLLYETDEIVVRTYRDYRRNDKSDSFGRYIADVYVGDKRVNDLMVEAGHAKYREYKEPADDRQ